MWRPREEASQNLSLVEGMGWQMPTLNIFLCIVGLEKIRDRQNVCFRAVSFCFAGSYVNLLFNISSQRFNFLPLVLTKLKHKPNFSLIGTFPFFSG